MNFQSQQILNILLQIVNGNPLQCVYVCTFYIYTLEKMPKPHTVHTNIHLIILTTIFFLSYPIYLFFLIF